MLLCTISDQDYSKRIEILRRNNMHLGFDKALSDYGIDELLGPPTGRFATIAAVSGIQLPIFLWATQRSTDVLLAWP